MEMKLANSNNEIVLASTMNPTKLVFSLMEKLSWKWIQYVIFEKFLWLPTKQEAL